MELKNKVNLKFLSERRKQMGFTLLDMAKTVSLKTGSNYYKYETGEYQLSANMLPLLAKSWSVILKIFLKNKFLKQGFK